MWINERLNKVWLFFFTILTYKGEVKASLCLITCYLVEFLGKVWAGLFLFVKRTEFYGVVLVIDHSLALWYISIPIFVFLYCFVHFFSTFIHISTCFFFCFCFFVWIQCVVFTCVDVTAISECSITKENNITPKLCALLWNLQMAPASQLDFDLDVLFYFF